MSTSGVRVESITTGAKPQRYAEGRVCKRRDCKTRLSAYNKQDFCYQHRSRKRPRVRGHEPLEVLPYCAKCAARARGHLKDFPEIVFAHVVHRTGVEGAAILCEGYLSTEARTPKVMGHDQSI